MTMTADHARLADLATFARIEVEAADIEPWAALLRAMRDHGDLDTEQTYWMVKCYNAFDDLGSAWNAARRWPSPAAWAAAGNKATIIDFPHTNERRNLRGGHRAVRHFDSYVDHLAGQTQEAWIRSAHTNRSPHDDFLHVLATMRTVWGTGRQSAFEWAEFVEKVLDVPIAAPDAQLWESEGPRRSLQKLYGNPKPTLGWLNDRANECRDFLAAEGVSLSWEDFETVICDFNVMRDGRYYPGRHLAAIREEFESIPIHDRDVAERAWHAVVPQPWNQIAPGIDKALCKVYRDTGQIISTPKVAV